MATASHTATTTSVAPARTTGNFTYVLPKPQGVVWTLTPHPPTPRPKMPRQAPSAG